MKVLAFIDTKNNTREEVASFSIKEGTYTNAEGKAIDLDKYDTAVVEVDVDKLDVNYMDNHMSIHGDNVIIEDVTVRGETSDERSVGGSENEFFCDEVTYESAWMTDGKGNEFDVIIENTDLTEVFTTF